MQPVKQFDRKVLHFQRLIFLLKSARNGLNWYEIIIQTWKINDDYIFNEINCHTARLVYQHVAIKILICYFNIKSIFDSLYNANIYRFKSKLSTRKGMKGVFWRWQKPVPDFLYTHLVNVLLKKSSENAKKIAFSSHILWNYQSAQWVLKTFFTKTQLLFFK